MAHVFELPRHILTCAEVSAITLIELSVMALAQATECNPPPLISPVTLNSISVMALVSTMMVMVTARQL